MLTQLRIQNFKSWADTGEFRLAPITGIFGANSSGKSSLLQFLLMLKQTTECVDPRVVLDFGDEKSRVSLGNFLEVVTDHDVTQSLSFSMQYTFVGYKNTARKIRSADDPIMDLKVAIKYQDDKLYLEKWKYSQIYRKPQVNSVSAEFSTEDETTGYTVAGIGERTPFFVETENPALPSSSTGHFYRFPSTIIEKDLIAMQPHIQEDDRFELGLFELTVKNEFKSYSYLGPLRECPARFYRASVKNPSDVGSRGEHTVDAILSVRNHQRYYLGAMVSEQKEYMPFEACIAYWLQKLGLVHSFELKEVKEGSGLFQVLLKTTPSGPDVTLPDVGFGVSQLLPVLVLCYYVPEGSTILLEQPEIHLHPSVQSGLADVFIDVAKNRNVQIILESHSEHLLSRLQRRMAEEELKHEDVALYFCTMDEQGRSQLDHLKIDEFGIIHNWPPKFFGDQFGEIAAQQEAQMERRQKQGQE
jgi:predicted ATPase